MTSPRSAVTRVLSWGVGVQSTALAVMSALGDCESVDWVINVDPGWERKGTYEVREFYVKWLSDHGLRVEVFKGRYDIRRDGISDHRHMPLWTQTGGLNRQCSREFKIRPIRRRVRELLGYDPSLPPHPRPGSVEKWIGFSTDELQRVKPSRVGYVVARFPLIETGFSRQDCVDYLQERELPVPVRSSCVCCPYHSAREWLEIKREDPEGWEDVLALDEGIRNGGFLPGVKEKRLYLYWARVPLAHADLEADAARCK